MCMPELVCLELVPTILKSSPPTLWVSEILPDFCCPPPQLGPVAECNLIQPAADRSRGEARPQLLHKTGSLSLYRCHNNNDAKVVLVVWPFLGQGIAKYYTLDEEEEETS